MMQLTRTLTKTLLAVTLAGSIFSTITNAEEKKSSTVITADEISWGYLNPLRGDKSPGAADLWGDRTKNVATGMLVRFNKGFTSPPHIHNITYRGVVIEGMMHNSDPNAEKMWMPTGSFWTQPAGENHVTAANGQTNLIFLEIDSGPYLVQPSDQHFDNGERPINLHESNLVWLNNKVMRVIEAQNVSITSLWGSAKQGEMGGSMVKLPAGFKGKVDVNASEFRAIIVKGGITYQSAETTSPKQLPASSYFSSVDKFQHAIANNNQETMIYIRTNGTYNIIEQ